MFSVILPVYNVEQYLDRCIKSIISQDEEAIEIILVDDGSTDNSPKICDKWSKMDSRIKVIHKKNAGLGMARNTGLENATKEYVIFVDSDDFIKKDLLKEAKKKIKQHSPDVVFWGFSRVDSNEKEFFTLIPTIKDVIEGKEYIMNNLLPDFIARNPYTGENKNLRISAWNCCIKRSVLIKNKIQFVSEREFISEDIYFYLQMFPVLNKVCFINKNLYCYSQNAGSLSFSYKKDRYQRIKKFYRDVEVLADDLHYDGNVQLRLKESFISTTMGCLKMEAANCNEVGIVKSYNRMKEICLDRDFQNAILVYPLEYYGVSWKLFFFCVRNKCLIILFILLYIQYIRKGI